MRRYWCMIILPAQIPAPNHVWLGQAAEIMNTPLDRPITCPVLVGRAIEIAGLRAILGAAALGHGQVILISGEAGIGKSRLVSHMKSDASARGFLTLEGFCFESDISYPYAPLLDLLRASFDSRLRSLGPDAADHDPIAAELLQALPDLAILFPDLGPPPAPSPQTQRLDQSQQKRRLFSLLTHSITAAPSHRPILLVIEDLHWSDESSLDFLLHLARHCKGRPLLLLFTYRSEEVPPGLNHLLVQLDRERLAVEAPLAHLSYDEVGAMLQAMLTMSHPEETGLVAPIYALTEGNPLFVEEALKSLIASGELQHIRGRWERRSDKGDPSSALLISRTVQGMVKQRVDRLSADARHALTVAAVSGRRFDFNLLQQALHGDEQRLLALLKELLAAQLVVEESAERFAFRHALVQQVIYGDLLARERMLLHHAIVEALESLHASAALRDAHVAELAYHAYAAGAWEKAWDYARRAGESALRLFAPGAAVEHLTHALEAARRLHATPPAAVYVARGQAYETRGDFDRALGDYQSALDLARQACDGAMVWRSMTALGFLWAGRNYIQAGQWFQRASDHAAHLADPTMRAHSLNRLGNWLLNTGRIEEGLQAHQEALRLFEEQRDTQGIAETLDLLGPAHGMWGDRISAVERIGQAITLFRAMDDTPSLMSSLAMRALQSMPGACETTLSPLRTREDCLQDATEAVRLACQLESLAGQAFAENALAHTLLSFGDFGPALGHAQEAARIATEIGHQQWKVATSYALGRIYLLLLAPAQAITALEAGLSLAQELGSRFWIATLAANLGRAHILNHNLPAAAATLVVLMPREPHEQHPSNVAERDVALTWGELALAEGDPGAALQIAQRLLDSLPGTAIASVQLVQPGEAAQPVPPLLKVKGEALIQLSRLDEAVESLEGARRGAEERGSRPVLWTLHSLLAKAYMLLKREEQAREEVALGRRLIQQLAESLDEASHDQLLLRAQFERAARDSLPGEKPGRPYKAAGRAREIKRAFGGLTAREREVAALVSQGKTSREIAGILVVQERTAEVHVSNILGKLGFTSRAQIAAWVVEVGLAKR
jgi:DNA-binding CsgD family transcriptional regulator/tetratricopeptide (TPR) repeat protein